MIRVGGSSYTNGIRFSATNYSVNFESYPNSTKIFLRKNEGKKTSKVLNFMSNIPLVRGVVSLIRDGKIMLFLLLLDFLSNTIIANTESESSLSLIVYGAGLILLGIIIWYVVTKMFKNLKSTWQYHGAEHKVIFTNYKQKAITLKNCRNAARISDNCGTMFASLWIFVFIITNLIASLFGINMWYSIRMVITEIVAYELFLLNRNVPVVRWLFKLGYWFQEHVCTREPSDLQLNQAIEAFTLLEKAETGQIPDEELEELLQKGKKASFLNKLF